MGALQLPGADCPRRDGLSMFDSGKRMTWCKSDTYVSQYHLGSVESQHSRPVRNSSAGAIPGSGSDWRVDRVRFASGPSAWHGPTQGIPSRAAEEWGDRRGRGGSGPPRAATLGNWLHLRKRLWSPLKTCCGSSDASHPSSPAGRRTSPTRPAWWTRSRWRGAAYPHPGRTPPLPRRSSLGATGDAHALGSPLPVHDRQ